MDWKRSLRQQHQRRQARTDIRTHVSTLTTPPTENNASNSEDPTPVEETRQSRRSPTLLRQFQTVIKAEEERAVATAVGRSLRWKPGRKPATTLNVPAGPTLTDNSANAQEVAATEAKMYVYT